MLTPSQLSILRQDLLEEANISYKEVLDELLDHYASLTEHGMDEGHSFDDASRKAWISLGSGQGISHIQERYKKLLLKQMQVQHWAIVRRYFRWPTLVTTLLIGVLAYLIAKAVPPGTLPLAFLVFVFAPYLLFIPGELRLFWRERIKKQELLTSLRREVVYRQARYGNYLYLVVIQLPALAASLFLDGTHWSPNRPYLFEWHAGLSAALAFVAILYTLTYVELYKKHSAQGFTTF
ncbi:hypothetical protein [Spirosoma linguale]|uniref:Uncharacterized protein n=1 Tax=Spirosoma linguale (strain ATCC 33905 / DSM 74 / LMG 10896 / Claus 1) TaxID=504472 RepID=D2QUI4_SPILD|nr:hypothetical protein Slin_6509 [Spirosoma linguale DSM 74]